MKPTPALLQIGDGDPIVLRLDQAELALHRPDGARRLRARVALEFDATPEFAGWWSALVHLRAQDRAPARQVPAVPGAVKVEFPQDWTAEQEAQWRAEFEE